MATVVKAGRPFIRHLIEASKIPSNRTYTSAKRRFLSFCSAHNIPPVPIAESTLCLYAGYLARQDLRHQIIRTYLSAVRHYYITQGFPNVFADNQFPRLQYEGVHRAEGPSDSSDKRLPITPTILGTLLEVWSVNDKDRFESSMLWAACCLGFLHSFGQESSFQLPQKFHSSAPGTYP